MEKILIMCLLLNLNFSNNLEWIKKDYSIKNDSLVIGKWSINAFVRVDRFIDKGVLAETETQVLYFESPKIFFLSNGSGKIEFPGKGICNFQWETKNSIIQFSFPTELDRSSFIQKDTIFKYKIYTNDSLKKIELIQMEDHYRYFLSLMSE